ncbi:hypothetical protein UFOVP225_76 [uncultured Caudovirales phage]|uniref:Uncharacterized protein n=1 Tax=uncultured Caudovirales phage TaxID=2100421 RepID=A0A6J5L1U9_9CAUD|nr:hypothetical protein UFOVP113_89 [uncultured Caudovirales phage]CAB5219483.1 hypothetical protein UFOVP225_76 [uncultured Caudovirales phage]
MPKKYRILSGEAFHVTARSEEEALAKFYVANGHCDEDDYEDKGFDFSDLDTDVEFLEVDTIAEPLDD